MSAEDQDFYRWYGRWDPLTPEGVASLLTDLPARWWIVGGWAVDAFTQRPRRHDDIDVSFFRADLPAVVNHLSPDLCVWSNLSGTLRPLRQADDLLDGCRQLWVRHDGDSPWIMDLAVNPHDGDTWISVRDDRIRLPLDAATFLASDGIRYLQPEVVLSHKARSHVRSDERDFDTILPMLGADARDWLRATLEVIQPGDPWIDRLS